MGAPLRFVGTEPGAFSLLERFRQFFQEPWWLSSQCPCSKAFAGRRLDSSAVALVVNEIVGESQPGLLSDDEEMAIGLEAGRVVERASFNRDALRFDLELREQGRSARGAEIAMNGFSGLARPRIAG
jgi:hypothetical protein